MTFRTVLFEKRESIAYVTLNRPKELNAYNIQMRDDLYEVFTAVRDDPDTQAMILSGTGRAFCSGADLTEFGTAPSPIVSREVRRERDVWAILNTLGKLSIAAVHGYVFGSGLELALLTDLRLAADSTVFGLPETGLGFIPAAGGTQSLPRIAKPGTALNLVLTGKRIGTSEAHRIGLVHRVVSDNDLLGEAEAMASKVLSAGPVAVALAKEAIKRGLDLSLAEGLELESRLARLAFRTSDAWEGMHAFVEGRAPVFGGA